MDVPFDLPPGVELMRDVSPAAWVAERLLPMDRSVGVRVGEVIPTGFDAYARIFHPASEGPGMRPVRWSELAERYGRTVHPEMQLEHIVGDLEIHRVPGLEYPDEGRLPRPEADALVGVLEPFTSTPDRCWMAIWEGFGSLGAGLAILWSGGDRATRGARERADLERRRRAQAQLGAIPRLSIHESPRGAPLRSYIVLRGPISSASRLVFNGSYHSPNLWWPEDRAWCVATEVDGYSTYIGGSAGCIAAVLAQDRLEAFPSGASNRFDLGSDRINPQPPGMQDRSST